MSLDVWWRLVFVQALIFSRPVDRWLWLRLLELLAVLDVEEREEPALLAREMGRGTGVTGGESNSTLSCVGEDEVEEFSCLRWDEEVELSSTVRTRWANFSEQTDSLMLLGRGDTWTIMRVLLSPLRESCSR